MRDKPAVHGGGPRRKCCRLIAFFATITGVLGGCCPPPPRALSPDQPDVAAYLGMILPARVKILSWTRPVSLSGDGRPDALEVVLAAYDALDDETKLVGNLHFELQIHRPAEQLGTRVAFWPVPVTTAEAMHAYLDRSLGFYRFTLQVDRAPLAPGRYTLDVQLTLPSEQRLRDSFEFDYDGSAAPAIRPA